MQRTLLAIGLLLLAGLAGCLGSSDDGSSTTPATPADGSQGEAATEAQRNFTSLTYPGTEPVFGVEWVNDTFEIQDSDQIARPARMAGQDPDNRHVIDITDRVPADVPVFVALEINAEAGQGDVDIWLNAPDAAIWSSEFDAPFGGFSHIEYTLVRSEGTPISVVAQLDELPDRAEVPYTLSIDVRSNPGLAIRGVPVSFQAGPDHVLELSSLDEGGEVEVLLFDPADAFLARVQGTGTTTFALDDEATSGRYVLMVPEGIRPVWLELAGPAGAPIQDPDLHLLEQDITFGPPQSTGSGGSATWSFDADRVPLQAGVLIQTSGASKDLDAALTGPAGELLSAMIEGGPWLQNGFVFLTDMGDVGLQPGTYEATVSFDVDAGEESSASEILVYYAR